MSKRDDSKDGEQPEPPSPKKIRMVNDLSITCSTPGCRNRCVWYAGDPRPTLCESCLKQRGR